MRVVAGTSPALAFERPERIVHAWDEAGAALDAGFWIAGYVEYDGVPVLGVYREPRETELAGAPAAHSPLLPRIGFDEYARNVALLQRGIYEGDVYQVNYTLPFDLHTQDDPFALWSHYARTSGARYQAFVDDGSRAIASWSPELFLEFDGATVRTKPMKGTAPLDRVDELHDEKNRAEHVMIVDLLRNDLQRVCDDVRVEAFLTIERYPTYATMTSTIAGNVREGSTLAHIFEATFPCGSITGAPKRSAMEFIRRCETQPRGAYCGAIGFLSPQRRGWWNVAIRTAQVDAGSGWGRFDAGGGIVADSGARSEWREVFLKTRFLRGGSLIETFAAGSDAIGDHLARLDRSARAFGIEYDGREAHRLATAFASPAIVRLTLDLDGRVDARTKPGTDRPSEPVHVCVSSARVRSDDPFLRHKTSWRPAHDRARAEAEERGCFEALLCNERGDVTEGSIANAFFELDGVLCTPPESDGVLPGILRARLLAQGRACERSIGIDDLRRARAAYVGNSARGLLRAEVVWDP